MQAAVAKLPGLQDVTSDLQIASPMVKVSVDRQAASALGVDVDTVKQTLDLAFGTDQITQLYTPTDEFEVIMEIKPGLAKGVDVLNTLQVRGTSGKLIPLAQLAKVTMGVGPSQISHDGQLPAATISFNLAPGVSLGQATQEISQLERSLNLPSTITTGFRGTAQVFQDSLSGQGFLIAAAVITIYIVLGCLYESFVHPITILSGLPSAAVGALATLILFKNDLSVISIIGLVMLIGIVKKNAIMMIDFAIQRRAQGYSSIESIREACLLRFRPIMMTTMSALMGALPIAFGWGAGGELRQPLGLTVVGGLVVSQALTLFITPVIYIYLENLATYFKRGQPVAGQPIKELAE
jgi:HAE1 family hydrophobic/amphiphilic exporter-1